MGISSARDLSDVGECGDERWCTIAELPRSPKLVATDCGEEAESDLTKTRDDHLEEFPGLVEPLTEQTLIALEKANVKSVDVVDTEKIGTYFINCLELDPCPNQEEALNVLLELVKIDSNDANILDRIVNLLIEQKKNPFDGKTYPVEKRIYGQTGFSIKVFCKGKHIANFIEIRHHGAEL